MRGGEKGHMAVTVCVETPVQWSQFNMKVPGLGMGFPLMFYFASFPLTLSFNVLIIAQTINPALKDQLE
jgi:hypothetical protein